MRIHLTQQEAVDALIEAARSKAQLGKHFLPGPLSTHGLAYESDDEHPAKNGSRFLLVIEGCHVEFQHVQGINPQPPTQMGPLEPDNGTNPERIWWWKRNPDGTGWVTISADSPLEPMLRDRAMTNQLIEITWPDEAQGQPHHITGKTMQVDLQRGLTITYYVRVCNPQAVAYAG